MRARKDDPAPPRTAAVAAARAAEMAAEAARAAEREEAAARFAERVAHIGSAVARELATPAIFDVVLDQTISTLQARFAIVFLADVDRRTLRLAAHRHLPPELEQKLSSFGFDESLLSARAAETRHAQTAGTIDKLGPALDRTRELLLRMGCQSVVALPLIARERLVGVLEFGLAEPHAFMPEECAALDNCAEIFSFGIANASAYEEERRLRALFEAIGKATVAITSEFELQPILQQIVDEARAVVDADYAALGILASEDRPFEPWVFSGLTREQGTEIGRHPRPVGTLGAVALEGRTLRVPDLRQHPAFRGFPAHHPAMTSLLGVPVHHEGRSVGNLYLANKRGAPEFTAEDERAIELLAAHAGAALHQKQLRDRLSIEQARFRAIVDHAPHGVVFFETSTRELTVNARAVELAGAAINQIDDYEERLLTPDRKALSREDWPCARAIREGAVPPHELLLRAANGEEVPILLSAARVADGGRPEGVVIVFEDISALKELQRLREEWASIVTHDLRQPLNVITTYVGMLQRMAQSPDPRRLLNGLDQTQKAARALNRMIDDLADVSQIEAKGLKLERRVLDPSALVRDVVERQRATAPERDLTLQMSAPIPRVNVDPTRIEQVLGNLLGNALKYGEPGTPVTVEVGGLEGELRVRVTNRGAGIAPEELPKVFDRYYRTPRARAGAARGLGLGLYIVKGLIEAHDGRVHAESRPGQTTTFEFSLPAAHGERHE